MTTRSRTRQTARGALSGAAVCALVGLAGAAWAGARWWQARAARDVARAALDADMRTVDAARRAQGAVDDTLRSLRAVGAPATDAPVIVVSLADNRLHVVQGDEALFSTGPPDWHYVEKAGKRRLGLLRMRPGQVLRTAGGTITTRGRDVVRVLADGSTVPLQASDGREIVVGDKLLIPPGGYNQRRYPEVLGTHRLNLGDGYALHGTNAPSSIGRSVSHGCVRLRNEDIETLYRMIPVGTRVYIY
ncbi:MAG: L,D-transpeptidase [Gemmatimonadaceae bacterium]|nr:L,D-transpeptidase [Gemmatimonadaceae bacterium]